MVIESSSVNLTSSRQYSYIQGRQSTRAAYHDGSVTYQQAAWESSYSSQEYYSSSAYTKRDSDELSDTSDTDDSSLLPTLTLGSQIADNLNALLAKNALNSDTSLLVDDSSAGLSSIESEASGKAASLIRTGTADTSSDAKLDFKNTVMLSILRMLERIRSNVWHGTVGTSSGGLTSRMSDIWNISQGLNLGYNKSTGLGSAYGSSGSLGSALGLSGRITVDGGLDLSSGKLWSSAYTIKRTTTCYVSESEATTFSGTGTAITSDGRKIDFGVELSMSRSFMQETGIEFVTSYPYVLTDPLVVNLSGSTADISDQTFYFDLDCDGEDEDIAQLGSGSGYLVLDRNDDGVINDGSEMFGAKTGDGFAELSEYDSDNNGWIDEADDIYSKLQVWTKDKDGNDVLMNLKESDIGAIYLGSSSSNFTVKDSDSEKPLAQIRSTGVFLHEDGSAGTINQVDF